MSDDDPSQEPASVLANLADGVGTDGQGNVTLTPRAARALAEMILTGRKPEPEEFARAERLNFYHHTSPVVEAAQWFRNGDHPWDGVGEMAKDPITGDEYERLEGQIVRFFCHPDVDGGAPCYACGRRMDVHGWIDDDTGGGNGQRVCPGDYVVSFVPEDIAWEFHIAVKLELFTAMYEQADPATL